MAVTEPVARTQFSDWLSAFETTLTSGDVNGVTSLFLDEGCWRDLVAFTWNIKTLEGPAAIADMLEARLADVRPRGFKAASEPSDANGMVEGWFIFDTAVAHVKGHVRLVDGKAWTVLTAMTDLIDFPEATGHNRPFGTVHKAGVQKDNWLSRRRDEQARLGYSEQPYCLIVGGGQAGIALAARLKQLDVPNLIIERNARAGDSWRNRYQSLCLHDPVWYDHMPYLRFPDNWPVFTPKDKMGDWLEMYTQVMELDFWGSADCKNASYDEATAQWTVQVERTVDGKSETVTLRPHHLVFATGAQGMPQVPEIPGAAGFTGTLRHSSQHPGGTGLENKRCIVLGSNNSAHDIAADLWEHSADVTMIQRSSSHVVKSETARELILGSLYSQEAVDQGLDVDTADLISASLPFAVLPQVLGNMGTQLRERDGGFYRQLEDAGFLLDFGADDTGLMLMAARRGGGYYIDVGASELIINGDIKLRSGVSIERLTADGALLTDGSELPADLIVLATGYGSMTEFAAQLISPKVADKVGKVGGLGSDTPKDPGPWEGEMRNLWKPTQQEGLWFHSGNLAMCRHFSRYLALQLKARMEGIDTPVYGIPEVHHLR